MFRWLRKFFYSGDPVVKVAGGLLEPEAEMWRELLANEGIPAVTKNTDPVSVSYYASPGYSFDLFVKQSDIGRAREILGPLLESGNG